MFNSKRIKELETKINLILDHLDLEYQPRLVKKNIKEEFVDFREEVRKTFRDDSAEIKKEEIPKKAKNKRVCRMCGETFAVKKGSKRWYCDKCKSVRLENSRNKYEAKKPNRQTNRKNRICRKCGKKFSIDKNSHRMYCTSCMKEKKRKYAKEWWRKKNGK